MFILRGKYTKAYVYTETIDAETIAQIQAMIDEPITKETTVRIMSDCHIGKGSTVGTTIRFHGPIERIVPNIVGVDIGCGILMRRLKKGTQVELKKLNEVIHKRIPSGFSVHSRSNPIFDAVLDKVAAPIPSDKKQRIRQSIGTLGGGNHYIELAQGDNEDIWLSIHSGSRSLGFFIAYYYEKVAKSTPQLNLDNKKNFINPAYAPLTGDSIDDYLHDMEIAQQFAKLNRHTMLDTIMQEMDWEYDESFDSIHNYIDMDNRIIRKGATSAQAGERLVIPLNMRDGSLICIGKGAKEWNYSAPHGAGRILSRTAAKKQLDLSTYVKQMQGVYTTSVGKATLDEAPDAYKPYEEIIATIQDTVDIHVHLKPLYNYKAH